MDSDTALVTNGRRPPAACPDPLTELVLRDDEAADLAGDLRKLLRAVRLHLGMDVAFVSEFRNDQRVFRSVDAATSRCPVEEGGGDPVEDSYCARVVDGRLPQLMHDASTVPAAAALPVTSELPVGAHLSVPLRLTDGRIYGTFCCFSFRPDVTLNERDLAVMRVFAELAAERIEAELEAEQQLGIVTGWVRDVESGEGVTLAFQPIIALASGRPAGYEALARFSSDPARSPATWIAEAIGAGLGVDLDLALIRQALSHLPKLPADAYLSLNVAPTTVTSGRLTQVVHGVPTDRVVLEITEHAVVESYEQLNASLRDLRTLGLRVSVDDAGAGYASFRHILQLQPEFIKLDLSLTRGIDRDPALRALASAMIAFAAETGSTIVAEGVETERELAALRSVGLTHAQGYYLGVPAPLPAVSAESAVGAASGSSIAARLVTR
ncbi:MAG: EAL domain-containing protein [Actinomycetota bacterium]|nr:EAL domain-containing protein [Actinomycetota bacterium]